MEKFFIPVVRTIFGRKAGKFSNRRDAVEIEVYYRSKRKRYPTGVRLYKSEWDDKNMVVRHPEARRLNERIREFRDRFDSYVETVIREGLTFDFQSMEECVLRRCGDGRTFIEFTAEEIKRRSDIREGTRKGHRKLLGALGQFGRIKYFSDLTTANLQLFDQWLHERYTVQTTVAGYHKLLKTYINRALVRGLIGSNPYAVFRYDRGKSIPHAYLTASELKILTELPLVDPSMERARDVFLFQCYTGLSYIDVAEFDFSRVIERAGRYLLTGTRQKTGERYHIMLLTPAMDILRKYGFRLPVVSNQKYNLTLKAVGQAAGLRISLTSHVGRHTFATWCLNRGVSVEVLAKMMGHANIKETQVYARMLDESVDRSFEMLERNLTPP